MSPWPSLRWLGLLGLLGLCCQNVSADHTFDARLKWFGTATALPEHDLQRVLDSTPAYDQNLDLRLMFQQQWSAVTLQIEHSTTYISGDSMAFISAPGTTLEQAPTGDERRLMDLTWEIDSGDRHQLLPRLDRLALSWRSGDWGVSVGRQAVSWGNGLVFQPMDLFNPFAPTTVDRDYKAGDDLLLVERLFSNGSDLALLAVGRRDENEDFTGQAASVAAKWRGFLAGGAGEVELMASKHFMDEVYAVSTRWPLSGALLRSDIVATRLDGGDWKLSFVVNVDYSLAVGGRTTYVFAEYFHNGFGVDELPESALELSEPLRDRLGRGELFNLMKDYLALGATHEWHPLWNQNLTLIGNLQDGSSLIQTQATYEPGDHQRLQIGVVVPLGSAGDEFGGVPLATGAQGAQLTTGGGVRGYLRWVYYF